MGAVDLALDFFLVGAVERAEAGGFGVERGVEGGLGTARFETIRVPLPDDCLFRHARPII